MLDMKKLQQITFELLEKHGVTPEAGAQYSIRCQYAQIENIVHDAMKKHTRDFCYFLEASGNFTEWEIEKIKAGCTDYTTSIPKRP